MADHDHAGRLAYLGGLVSADRDVVRVGGDDAVRYLQSQLTCDVAALGDGGQAWSFVLEPAGKIDVLLRVTRTGEGCWLDTDRGYGEALLARLRRFLIRLKVDLAFEPARDPDTAADPAGEAARIEAGWPRMGAEIVPGVTIPAETGITDVAVSFTKGCYPGQELVERMASRGVAPRRLLRTIDVAAGTEPGARVVVDGHPAEVTSVAGRRALAYVSRSSEAASGARPTGV